MGVKKQRMEPIWITEPIGSVDGLEAALVRDYRASRPKQYAAKIEEPYIVAGGKKYKITRGAEIIE